jgi:hypothetical protein
MPMKRNKLKSNPEFTGKPMWMCPDVRVGNTKYGNMYVAASVTGIHETLANLLMERYGYREINNHSAATRLFIGGVPIRVGMEVVPDEVKK